MNVRSRASLYQTIERLQRLGLVEVRETVRPGATPIGSSTRSPSPARAAREWLREMLRETGGDYPEFIAAVSIMFYLTPDDARRQLE